MQVSEVPGAVAAGMSTASMLDLTADDAIVLNDSNRLVLRLLPCDIIARVAHIAHQAGAAFEVELARRLAQTESPVATLAPRVEPQIYVHDGFVVTLWTYYEGVPPLLVAPAEYAHALERLHASMRQIDMATPHFTDRVAEAQRLVDSRDHTPDLPDADRELLSNTLRSLRRAVVERGGAEQLLHGEPHPGNLLRTKCVMPSLAIQESTGEELSASASAPAQRSPSAVMTSPSTGIQASSPAYMTRDG